MLWYLFVVALGILGTAVLIGVLVYALARRDLASREEGSKAKTSANKDPCDTCVRWWECNGVDKDCPWRVKNGN